jgi:calcium-dependent protein kinase
MGICFSSTKVVSGSNSNTTNNENRKRNSTSTTKTEKAPVTTTTSTAATASATKKRQVPSSNQRRRGSEEAQKKTHQSRLKDKANSRVPCGKRTDFGYEKDFDKRFSLGKLLGHGQFGYTYVGIDKSNGDRVAVKRLEKAKVFMFDDVFFLGFFRSMFRFCYFVFLVNGFGRIKEILFLGCFSDGE